MQTPSSSTGFSDVPTERRLVELARSGDHDAFARLVDARLAPTLRTVTAVLGNEADARDVTQRIFIQAWRQLPALREIDAFPAWLGRIVVNACRSALRERSRRLVREIRVSDLGQDSESLVVADADHEDRAMNLDRLGRALSRIRPDERVVLWLHHYEELSLAEIGERIGVPAKTVKSRLYTARRALERALLAEDHS